MTNERPGGLPYDIDAPTRSESVLLAGFDLRDASGFMVRLAPYPEVGVAWLWAVVIHPDGTSAAYNVDHLPTEVGPVDPDGEPATFRLVSPAVTMHRDGPRDHPESARLSLEADGHAGTSAPNEPGDVALAIDATFEPFPVSSSVATLAGRSEPHGRVRASLRIGDATHEFDGFGQWHEQLQDQPRFRAGFRYACLVGEFESLVALQVARGGRGWRRDPDGLRELSRVSIEPDGADGWVVEVDDSEGTHRYRSAVRHRWTLPLYGRPWRGTRVTTTGVHGPLAGMVNEFDPEGEW